MPCSLVELNPFFGGTYASIFRSNSIPSKQASSEQQLKPEAVLASRTLVKVYQATWCISQKIILFIITSVRAANLKELEKLTRADISDL
jgi:hypothetical protein